MKFLKTLHCNICTLNTITHTHTIVQQHRLCYVLSSVNIAVPNYSQMLRLPAGVSFKSHVRDVPPRLMSVFNFTTFDFGQVSTFDWIIHLEPALKLFVLLLKQCRVELLQLRLWRLSQLGRRRRNGPPFTLSSPVSPEHTVHRLNTLSAQCSGDHTVE